MDIIRNDDGTLVVPVAPVRSSTTDEDAPADEPADEVTEEAEPGTRVLHPGEGGYDEALAEWDLQQNPDREAAVSTSDGRQSAMRLVHEVAASPDQEVAPALEQVDDVEATGEALRHVLVGGTPSVEDFAREIAEAEGGDPISAHDATRIIGEVLAAIE
ncbi:MAG: hypothetical protein ACSLFP_12445 [Acidimicrobiales bacterium]